MTASRVESVAVSCVDAPRGLWGRQGRTTVACPAEGGTARAAEGLQTLCVDWHTVCMAAKLGDVLRRGRVLKRMSQGAVGDAVGYSASWVSRVENGKVRPDDTTLAALCDVLGLSGNDVGLEGADVHRRKVLLSPAPPRPQTTPKTSLNAPSSVSPRRDRRPVSLCPRR
ncbi:helix-turn-helix domain-containing protein [Streptomyces sp. NPDC052236]|uniref:helix-turn-helix domain-containing protein n=1 Tax=Streptomyces sp. NPDC052236 TaxID=3365686 RepID=UPI0037D681D1